MKISAQLILASKNAATGDVLTTMVLTYPRIILSEMNTHRMLSKNTSSSRAIPGKKTREAVLNDPFIPIYIGQSQKGMQAGPELRGWRRTAAESVFSYGRYVAVFQNWLLEKLGVHKQVSNRLLEPYMWVRQVVTATDWQNFLKLRNHKDAEPHFRELARCIARELREAQGYFDSGMAEYFVYLPYRVLQPGEWHIPFITLAEQSLSTDDKLAISAARAARTSYTLAGQKQTDYCTDLALAKRLIAQGHLSPLEHQAQAANNFRYYGNLKSFIQYRKTIDGEDGGDRTYQENVLPFTGGQQ
jgi:hypothetical protein